MQRCLCLFVYLFVCLFVCLFWYPGTAFLVDFSEFCVSILILEFFAAFQIVEILIGKFMICFYNYLKEKV